MDWVETFRDKRIVFVVGNNGAGKTRLLQQAQKHLPNVLTLDNADCTLDITRCVDFGVALQRAAEHGAGFRLFVVVYAPFTLAAVDSTSVFVVARGSDGHSYGAWLPEAPKYEKFRTALHPGELWANFGSDWVAAAPGAVLLP